VILAAVGTLLVACESGKSPGYSGGREVGNKEVANKEVTNKEGAPGVAAAQPAVQPKAAEPKAEGAGHAGGVEWRGSVEWHTWNDGLALAGKSGKPIFVLVYADWCPHCRTLGPIFAEPEMEALAKHFVMVRQNHDDDPAWLQPYKQYGSYVPRIFFFDPRGKLREDVTSGHPRYPYFYASEQPAFLKQSMRRVIGS